MNTTTYEKTIKELFVGKCWEYLDNNFHKFNETNKIKIALEVCKKDIPTNPLVDQSEHKHFYNIVNFNGDRKDITSSRVFGLDTPVANRSEII